MLILRCEMILPLPSLPRVGDAIETLRLRVGLELLKDVESLPLKDVDSPQCSSSSSSILSSCSVEGGATPFDSVGRGSATSTAEDADRGEQIGDAISVARTNEGPGLEACATACKARRGLASMLESAIAAGLRETLIEPTIRSGILFDAGAAGAAAVKASLGRVRADCGVLGLLPPALLATLPPFWIGCDGRVKRTEGDCWAFEPAWTQRGLKCSDPFITENTLGPEGSPPRVHQRSAMRGCALSAQEGKAHAFLPLSPLFRS